MWYWVEPAYEDVRIEIVIEETAQECAYHL